MTMKNPTSVSLDCEAYFNYEFEASESIVHLVIGANPRSRCASAFDKNDVSELIEKLQKIQAEMRG